MITARDPLKTAGGAGMRLVVQLGARPADEPPSWFLRGDALALLNPDATERYLRGQQLEPRHLSYHSAHRVIEPASAPKLLEGEVSPLITRLLQRGGNACI